MSHRGLWLSQNANWYRRISVAGKITSTASRFIQELKAEGCDFAVLQLPLPQEGLAAIAVLWEALPVQPAVILFDPTHSLKVGEFPEACPAEWRLLRSSDEESVRKTIAEIGATTAPPQAEPWRTLLVGRSSAMSEIRELIGLVAKLNTTILITGATGTGKEVAARAIHLASKRADKPFVAINCAALPDTLLEAELFGHTKGAFTGAANARVGLFEQADGGTIFLDEIGDMPLELQTKLLRVLQERQIQRLGSSEVTPVNVRIITATNADLRELCMTRRFRQDLYFRLNVVPIQMPNLKDRPEDVDPLLNHFLNKVAVAEELPLKQIDDDARAQLAMYSWPGNVRELEHAVERAIAITGTRKVLRFQDFGLQSFETASFSPDVMALEIPDAGFDFEAALQQFQLAIIGRAMQKAGGNKQRAANLLGMKRTTMLSKCKSLEYTV